MSYLKHLLLLCSFLLLTSCAGGPQVRQEPIQAIVKTPGVRILNAHGGLMMDNNTAYPVAFEYRNRSPMTVYGNGDCCVTLGAVSIYAKDLNYRIEDYDEVLGFDAGLLSVARGTWKMLKSIYTFGISDDREKVLGFYKVLVQYEGKTYKGLLTFGQAFLNDYARFEIDVAKHDLSGGKTTYTFARNQNNQIRWILWYSDSPAIWEKADKLLTKRYK